MYLQKEFVPYSYFIMCDFEALHLQIQSTPTEHLTPTSTHIPVSVAVNDNLANEPTFLEHSDPETLIQLFIEKLTRQQTIISERVGSIYPMMDASSLPE